MTNYNERLDEVLDSYADYYNLQDINRFTKEQMSIEFPHVMTKEKAKQALTSLIKELVAEASNKMSEQEIYAKVAEKAYWFHVVKEYMTHVADWRYLEEAVQGLLDGKHNQEYISDAIKWPVLRWRELNKELADVSAT